jgi:SAM-dependent methyltransferase
MNGPEPLERRLGPHAWGEGSELWGPRHDYRESLIIRMFLPRLDGRRVLNAGCGAGSLTLKLLDAGCEVTSLDRSQPFVEGLAIRLREAHPGVDSPVLVGDVCEMPFAGSEFDGVVCGEVLEHLDDDLGAVREIARVLRPGGVLVASVPANPWRYDWIDHWAGHRRRYTAEGLRQLMVAAELDQVDVIPWGFPLSGLYHRVVYERLLRRRLESGSPGAPTPRGRPPGWLLAVARGALELDSVFLGRRPGYLGFLVTADKPNGTGQGAPRQ